MVVAMVGLLINLLVLRLLHGHAHDDVNMGAASLHVLSDLFGSLGAVLAAAAVRWLGWDWADPVLSLLVSLLILAGAWRLLRRSAHILLIAVSGVLHRCGRAGDRRHFHRHRDHCVPRAGGRMARRTARAGLMSPS